MLDARLALALGGVHTHAKFLVVAEAARHVDGRIGVAARFHAHGQFRQRRVSGALGHQVDGAADAAAARRGAVQEGAGATEHFHALEQFRRYVLTGQHAVQAVIRHVIGIEGEAADHIHFLEIAIAARHAHGRIALQQVAHAARLLIGNELLRITGAAEWRVHHVHGAEYAHAPAARHLAARIRLRQTFRRGIGGGVHEHRGHGLRVAGRLHEDGLGMGGAAGQQEGGQGEGGRGEAEGAHGVVGILMRMIIIIFQRCATCGKV